MIPVTLDEASYRRQHFDKVHNAENLKAELDHKHEVQEEACIREATTKQYAVHTIILKFERDPSRKETWSGECSTMPTKTKLKARMALTN